MAKNISSILKALLDSTRIIWCDAFCMRQPPDLHLYDMFSLQMIEFNSINVFACRKINLPSQGGLDLSSVEINNFRNELSLI